MSVLVNGIRHIQESAEAFDQSSGIELARVIGLIAGRPLTAEEQVAVSEVLTDFIDQRLDEKLDYNAFRRSY